MVIRIDKKIWAFIAAGIVVAFVLGIIIGNVTAPGGDGKRLGETSSQRESKEIKSLDPRPTNQRDLESVDKFQNKELIQQTLESVSSEKLRDFLKELSKEPHIAASARDEELTSWIRSQWKEFGLDVSLSTYDFLLSYPNQTNPNKIHLLDANGSVEWTSRHKEEVLRQEDVHPDFIHAFNAYTPNADVMGELVFVNYGRVEDLQELEKLGVDLRGKIAISKYGKIFRGNRVKNCEDKGAIGVIMFSDPADVAVQGTDPEDVYPYTFFLPESGIQRGSTFIGSGDPLSPGWTSLKGAYRMSADDVEGLPKIPAQPIGYGDAKRLLTVMGGEPAPQNWQGKIANVTYRLGGSMDGNHEGWKVRLVVNNYMEDKESSNVIGVIKGEEEPDRYVLLSNHRDAWGYGAIDPSSGTTSLMEVARVLGALTKKGWKPRRTLVFASWAAEESGLEGSYEWVYDKIHKIMSRAVSVINVDICVKGSILRPSASPIIKDVFLEAIKTVKDPDNQSRTYYEFYKEYIKQDENPDETVEDKVTGLGSGSDHAGFIFYAGVPAMYFDFSVDKHKYPGFGSYPAYHTGFETFYLVDKIIDPGFKYHRTCSQLSTHMMLHLGEASVLPFTTQHLLYELEKALDNMVKNNVTKTLEANGAMSAYNLMTQKLQEFKSASIEWSRRRDNAVKDGVIKDPLKLRMFNDQIMLLERVFLLPTGLPGRPDTRHALFSPSKFNSYGSSAFPGISDLLHEVDKLGMEDKKSRFEEIKKHLSDLMIVFHQAKNWLSNFDEL